MNRRKFKPELWKWIKKKAYFLYNYVCFLQINLISRHTCLLNISKSTYISHFAIDLKTSALAWSFHILHIGIPDMCNRYMIQERHNEYIYIKSFFYMFTYVFKKNFKGNYFSETRTFLIHIFLYLILFKTFAKTRQIIILYGFNVNILN